MAGLLAILCKRITAFTNLLHKMMSLDTVVRPAVNGHSVIVELEAQLQRLRLDATVLEATRAQ